MEEKHIGTAKVKTYIQITRITIVICWISLFAFLAIKLFGGNFFEIVVKNKNFIKFCKFADNNLWFRNFINLITTLIGNYFLFGAISQKFKFRWVHLIIVVLLSFSMWFVVKFIPNFLNISFWYGYVVLIVYSIIVNKKWKKLFGLFAVVLQFAFTSISMVTRNIPLEITLNFIVGNILLIDLYIMYILYYLYANLIKLKKEI